MIHIKFNNKQFGESFESEAGFVTGTAFTKDGQKLSGKPLMDHLATFEEAADLASSLPGLNGFYAFVVNNGNHLFAAVDRIRSIPIFYGNKGQDLFVSDDARWVREQISDVEMDPLAREEFLLTGYVTGQDTLSPGVKQVQAGELVSFQQDPHGKIRIEQRRYYRYLHTDYFHASEDELHQKLDKVLVNIFNRLITYADGRTIVVPLSGGYDSRLIVLMLKRMGYENVVAFSYGRAGNHEAEISKKVAESLGIRWEFVEYSNDLWREWYESLEMKAYFDMAGNLASLPHIQDWPAVKVLQQQGRIPNNSIFVPGHSADLPAGSRSKSVPDLYNSKGSTERLIDAIIGYHYNLFDWSKKKRELFPFFEKKILEVLGDLDQYPDQSSAFESWDISERQPKFIVNSLRVYEFFGYDWWIPFWDKEFMDYWCRISPEKRLNQSLYIKFVDNLAKERGVVIQEKETMGFFSIKKLISIAKRVLPEEIKNWLRTKKRLHSYKNDPMGWYGIHDDKYVLEQIRDGASMINSLLAVDYINELHGRKTQD